MKTILLTDVSNDLDLSHMANKGKYMKTYEYFYIEKEVGRHGSTWYVNKPTWKSQRKKGKHSCVGGIRQYVFIDTKSLLNAYRTTWSETQMGRTHCLQRVGERTTRISAKFSFLQMPLFSVHLNNCIDLAFHVKQVEETVNMIILRKKKNHKSRISKNFYLLWPKRSSISSPCLNCDGITVLKVNMLGQLLQTEQPAVRVDS